MDAECKSGVQTLECIMFYSERRDEKRSYERNEFEIPVEEMMKRNKNKRQSNLHLKVIGNDARVGRMHKSEMYGSRQNGGTKDEMVGWKGRELDEQFGFLLEERG